ncbi:MAG TPA: DinB family protein [Gemmatimonadales bacterium]|jgi:crotonobetainyl-CoA:carnitine CoA-transferase CaiB-like acyl-CoA transferase|nr:DinB family protein [Gemmatimonadales bacterium]
MTQQTNAAASHIDTTLVQTVVRAWQDTVARADKTLAEFSDADLQREVAAGRNRIYYLLGHLTAVQDRLVQLMRVGERKYAALDEAFITSPDRAHPDTMSAADLRAAWHEVNERLAAALHKLTPAEWLERHNTVSPDDFAKEPLRNRLAVLIARTTHLTFHEGQMRLAIPRK